MKRETHKLQTRFLSSVNALLESIEDWSKQEGLVTARSEITITEDATGTYSAATLHLKDSSGKNIADVLPIGASILGAKGRVDIVGQHDKVILVELDIGGPQISTTTAIGDQAETHGRMLYRGIDKEGWYWIESKVSSKGHVLSKELFLDLLAAVSDYERR